MEAELLSAIASLTGRDDVQLAQPVKRLSGGYSAELFVLRLADARAELDGEFVLRIMHSDPEARREVAIQRTVSALGFPAPKVRLHGDSTAALGRPFMIMDRVVGRNLLRASGPRAFSRIPLVLAELMVRLHSLDSEPVVECLAEADVLPSGSGSAAILRGLEATVPGLERADLQWSLAWLLEREQSPSMLAVCHCDLHALNVLVNDGRVTGVVDWELATIDDPVLDVARTSLILRALPSVSSRLVRKALSGLGQRAAERFVACCRAERHIDPERLQWHEALHAVRLITMILRSQRGLTSPSRVIDAWVPCVSVLEDRLRTLVGRTPEHS